jgi:hypothetical protein
VDTIRIRPAPGRRVRDASNVVVPPEGIIVLLLPADAGAAIGDRLSSLWRRRLDDGDIVLVTEEEA